MSAFAARRPLAALPILTAVAGALAACSLPRQSAPEIARPDAPEVAIAPRQAGPVWIFADDASTPRLMFGTANSDDVRLSLTCVRGAPPRVLISRLVESAPVPPVLTLRSGQTRGSWLGRAEPSQLGAGAIVVVETTATDPLLTSFRSEGRLAIETGAGAVSISPTAQERETVARFFERCSG